MIFIQIAVNHFIKVYVLQNIIIIINLYNINIRYQFITIVPLRWAINLQNGMLVQKKQHHYFILLHTPLPPLMEPQKLFCSGQFFLYLLNYLC